MKKIYFFALSVFLAVVSFSACGNEDDDESENNKENSPCECDQKDNESNSTDETNFDFEYRILTDSTVAIKGFNIVPQNMIIPDKVKIKGESYTVTEIYGGSFNFLYGEKSIEIPQTVTKICSLSAGKIILHKSQEDIVQMISNSNFSFYNVMGDLYFTEGTAGYGSMYLESGKTYTATNSLKNFSFKVSIKDYYIEEYGYQKTYRKTFIKIDGFNEELVVVPTYISYLHWDENKFYIDSNVNSDGSLREDFDKTNVVAVFSSTSMVKSPILDDYYVITSFNIK
ncbi:MAG: hypothetical protein KIH03_10000 [Paludibacteraceae bacterium]|nr:hypothetical protein [Paludibacteraceae bacterium]